MEIKINNKQYKITGSGEAEYYTSKDLISRGFEPVIYCIMGKKKDLHIAYKTIKGNYVIVT
jgi:hypothetical protein